jgi:predicted metal-dependent hydrolase
MSGQPIYRIKRQKRKTLALHILDDASVEVRAPKWVSQTVIEQFVADKQSWLLTQQQKQRSRLQDRPGFRDGQQHSLLGESITLRLSLGSKLKIELREQQLFIAHPYPDDEQQIKKAWHDFCRQRALAYFSERLSFWLPAMPSGTPQPQLKVRRMRCRWGSCSSRAVITLNTHLIELPAEAIDYVIVHELCHLWELNHSDKFYTLLASILPDWRQREDQIKHY